MFENLFDVYKVSFFFRTNERDRLSLFTSATGTADTVNVVFRYVWKLEIYYVWKVGNVDSARGDIGGDEDTDVVRFEVLKGAFACGLTFVAMDRGGSDSIGVELLCEAVCSVFGAREYENLAPVAIFDKG